MVDVFYDHLLARNWGHWHSQTLPVFNASLYGEIAARVAELPDNARLVCGRMRAQDWLSAYASEAGISDTFARMALRVRRENPLSGSERHLFAERPGFADDCAEFLSDARDFANAWVSSQASE